MLVAVTRIKAHTHTHTMPILLGVYVLASMSVYLHKRKTNPAHNLSVLCTQHHTVLHTEFAEWKAAYEAEHDVMFVKSTGYKATDGCTTSYTTSAIDRVCSTQRGQVKNVSKVMALPKLTANHTTHSYDHTDSESHHTVSESRSVPHTLCT